MPLRKLLRFTALITLSAFAIAALADVPTHDIPGGHDSPLVSRFPGSTIIGYHTVDFDQAVFPLGKYDNGTSKFTKTETVAGRVIDIAYAAPANKSAFEVFHNYQAALTRAGFVTQYQCANDACGDRFNLTNAIVDDNIRGAMTGNAGDANYGNSMIELLWCNGGELHLVTARLTRSQGNVDLSLQVCGNPGKRVGVLLQIVQEKPMQTGEVTVDAEAMGQGLAQNGHIALYGIHFATDSAALTPDSNATLAQMVALLKSQPKLKVYIVGHTDNTGALQHNLVLSQRRADSVVKALEQRGIAASRLAAKGLASYAPVASNATDAGRAKNRRVELVQQ